jgi:hypothetical protein
MSDKPSSSGVLRNRVIERRRILGSELTPNPRNWRLHDQAQTDALQEILTSIGMAGELLAYTSEREGGKLVLINGHLRSGTWADEHWDVAITDLTDAEADKLLAAMDPVGAAAGVDEEKLRALLLEIDTECAALQDILNDQAGLKTAKEIEDATVELEYHVIIRCDNESDQLLILGELDKNGLDCRAVCAGFAKPAEKKETQPPTIEVKGRTIKREVAIDRTPRVRQMEGIFDVPPAKRAERTWQIDFALDRPWAIGLIVGPSGSGKTTLAKELFAKELVAGWPWPVAPVTNRNSPATTCNCPGTSNKFSCPFQGTGTMGLGSSSTKHHGPSANGPGSTSSTR